MGDEALSASERAAGVLLGLAAGDKYGGPTEMAVRLAESLIVRRAFVAEDVLARYLDWYREGAYDTGPIAKQVLDRIVQGETPEQAVRLVHQAAGGMTAGCNPAHRCVPLAATSFLRDKALPIAARQEAALTHYAPLAGETAAAVVTTLRGLIQGMDWPDALEAAGVQSLLDSRKALPYIRREELDRGGFAPHVLMAAAYFLFHYDRFDLALEASLAFAGQGNYCPVLVGAMGGARWGVRSVPEVYWKHVANLARVRSAADKLAAEWKD